MIARIVIFGGELITWGRIHSNHDFCLFFSTFRHLLEHVVAPFRKFQCCTPSVISDPFARSIICLVQLFCDPCHGSGLVTNQINQWDCDGINERYGPNRSIAILGNLGGDFRSIGFTSPVLWAFDSRHPSQRNHMPNM